ncbi:flagellar protein FlaG [Sutcliffiella halmapala]|uniref:flagellar protein FlaG n=1 Tax=Sutcliffiella halmapala TaxID=79882 RepID=UPI000995912B|nr:flagellar protein FlaG [Sutcliffiella halmapala]
MNISQVGTNIDNSARIKVKSTETNKVDYSIEEAKQLSPVKSKESIIRIVEGMNELITPLNVSVRFEFHEELNEYFVKVVDALTDEVIREVPPKKFLDMYAAMTEYMGLFVDKKI